MNNVNPMIDRNTGKIIDIFSGRQVTKNQVKTEFDVTQGMALSLIGLLVISTLSVVALLAVTQ